MIVSTKGKLIAALVTGGPVEGFPQTLVRAAERKLAYLDAPVHVEDLRSPPGNRLELLGGDRAGQYSIRINDQWRLCFRWTEAGAEDVEIVDYH